MTGKHALGRTDHSIDQRAIDGDDEPAAALFIILSLLCLLTLLFISIWWAINTVIPLISLPAQFSIPTY